MQVFDKVVEAHLRHYRNQYEKRMQKIQTPKDKKRNYLII